MKEEIESKHWKTLFERLNDFERGQLVNVQLVEHNGSQRELGRALTLENITFEPMTACVDGVRIRASDGFSHTALEPLHIRLIKNPSGGFNPVEIDDSRRSNANSRELAQWKITGERPSAGEREKVS